MHPQRADRVRFDGVADPLLLTRLRAGDCGALETLLDRHWAAVYRYASRRTRSTETGASLAQSVFCSLWERRASWDDAVSARALLFRLARAAPLRRDRGGERGDRCNDSMALDCDPGATIASSETSRLCAAIRGVAATLHPRQREVFLLRVLDGLSYDEIAAVLLISGEIVAAELGEGLATMQSLLGPRLD
jgi:RNA polymerase sigma-70 factor (ECF subfamily)